eukprot:INCI14759.1.p1 GENE.INCI14759.1~~INCI14759.1.p1  ORF type:complete len:1069 (+),score=177.38 INCI14759.1:252-3458(+)
MIVDEFSPVESPSTTCAEQEQVFLNDDEVPIDFLRLSEEDATEVAIDACVADNSPLLRALSKRSPNFNPSRNDRDGDAPVHYAVSCKSSDCLLALLEARADATSRSSDGSNCLHIAAQYGLWDVVRPLLRSNITLDDRMPDGTRALDIAILRGQRVFAHRLLDMRCDVNCRNAFTGDTSLRVAFDARLLDVFEHMLEQGARAFRAETDHVFDIDDVGNGGSSPGGSHNRDPSLHPSLVSVLVQQKAFDFLDCISRVEMPSPPQSHVSDGSPVNDAHPAQAFNCVFNRKEDGFPAFFHALYQPDTDVFEYFVKAGCDLRSSDDAGATAFIVACFEGNLAIVRLLLEGCCGRGVVAANPTCKDCANITLSDGFTALHLAVENDMLPLLELLCEYAPRHSRITRKDASVSSNTSGGRGSTNAGSWHISVDAAMFTTGATPLHFAARKSDPSFAASLISAGASVQSRMTIHAFTPLHLAAQSGTEQVVSILLRGGANSVARSSEHLSPLAIAVQLNKVRSAALMVQSISDALDHARAPKHVRLRAEVLDEVVQCLTRTCQGQGQVGVFSCLFKLCRDHLPKAKLVDLGARLRQVIIANGDNMSEALRTGYLVQIDIVTPSTRGNAGDIPHRRKLENPTEADIPKPTLSFLTSDGRASKASPPPNDRLSNAGPSRQTTWAHKSPVKGPENPKSVQSNKTRNGPSSGQKLLNAVAALFNTPSKHTGTLQRRRASRLRQPNLTQKKHSSSPKYPNDVQKSRHLNQRSHKTHNDSDGSSASLAGKAKGMGTGLQSGQHADRLRRRGRVFEREAWKTDVLKRALAVRWDRPCLQQMGPFQFVSLFLSVREVLQLGIVCRAWSQWVGFGNRPFWCFWATERRNGAASQLSNFERGVLWQRLMLSAHPMTSANQYFALKRKVRIARDDFQQKQQRKVLRRKLADARRGLETLMNKLQAAGSTGMMSPEDQQRWARLEADEQKLLRQLESVDGDGNGNGVSLHKDEPVTASSGSLGGDASRLPQRRHTREVSAFAMVSADVSRTFQSFDFSSGFTVVAMAQVRDVLVWPWVCVMTTEFRV